MSFELPRLYPIIDTASLRRWQIQPVAAAEAMLEAGVRILQFRHKEFWTQTEYDEAKQISVLARQAGVTFVVNDRADYAALLGAGVHVGQDDLPPVAVRRVTDGVLGYSTHNRQQLLRGETEPVDYLAVGPIYQTNSKKNPDPVLGVEGVRRIRPLTRKPLVAIGGITLRNAPEVLGAGADSVAVIGGLLPVGATVIGIRNLAAEWLATVTTKSSGLD